MFVGTVFVAVPLAFTRNPVGLVLVPVFTVIKSSVFVPATNPLVSEKTPLNALKFE